MTDLQYSLSITSQLMENYTAGSPIDSSSYGCALQMCIDPDNTAFPMIFSHGTDGHVYLLRKVSAQQQNSVSTGWNQTCVTENLLQAGDTITSFAVGGSAQSGSFIPVLAYAKTSTSTGTSTNFYLVTDFSSPSAIGCGSSTDPVIQMTAGVSGLDSSGMIVATTRNQQSNLLTTYLLSPSATAQSLSFGVDGATVSCSVVGHLTYLENLYGEAATLFSLVDNNDGTSGVYVMTLPNGYYAGTIPTVTAEHTTAIGVGNWLPASAFDGTNGGTALFIANEGGIFYIDPATAQGNSDAAGPALLASPGAYNSTTIASLQAASSEIGGHEVFARTTGGAVYRMAKATVDDSTSWSPASLMYSNVQALGCFVSQQDTPSTELAVLDTQSQLTHYVRDPITSLWSSSQIALQDITSAVNCQSYVVRMQLSVPFSCSTSTSLPSAITATVSTSQVALLRFNGSAVYTSPTQSATVPFNTMGVLAFTCVVTSLSCLSISFSIDGGILSEVLTMSPTKAVADQLAAVNEGSLQSAQVPSQKTGAMNSLVPAANQQYAKAAATALNSLATASVAHTGTPVASGTVIGLTTVVVDANTNLFVLDSQDDKAQTVLGAVQNAYKGKLCRHGAYAVACNRIDVSKLPADFGFHLSCSSGNNRMWTARPTAAAQKSDVGGLGSFFSEVGDWLASAASNVAQFIEKGFDMAVSVVDGALQVILTVGSDVVNLVAHAVEEVVSLAHWVFTNVLEAAFEDLVSFLGKIFAWLDILSWNTVIQKSFYLTVTSLDSALNPLFTTLSNGLTDLQQDVNSWSQTGAVSSVASDPNGSANVGSTASSAQSQNQNPHSTWATDCMANSNTPSDPSNGSSSNAVGNQSLFSTPGSLAQEADSLITSLEEALGNCLDVVSQDFTNALPGIMNAIQSGSISNVFKQIAALLADTFVSTAQTCVSTIQSVISALMSFLTNVLTTSFEIPVLSGVFRAVLNEDVTVLNLFSFVLAMGTSILMGWLSPNSKLSSSAVTQISNCTSLSDLLPLLAYDTLFNSQSSSSALKGSSNVPGSWTDVGCGFCTLLYGCMDTLQQWYSGKYTYWADIDPAGPLSMQICYAIKAFAGIGNWVFSIISFATSSWKWTHAADCAVFLFSGIICTVCDFMCIFKTATGSGQDYKTKIGTWSKRYQCSGIWGMVSSVVTLVKDCVDYDYGFCWAVFLKFLINACSGITQVCSMPTVDLWLGLYGATGAALILRGCSVEGFPSVDSARY
jgi:hypothetical protein